MDRLKWISVWLFGLCYFEFYPLSFRTCFGIFCLYLCPSQRSWNKFRMTVWGAENRLRVLIEALTIWLLRPSLPYVFPKRSWNKFRMTGSGEEWWTVGECRSPLMFLQSDGAERNGVGVGLHSNLHLALFRMSLLSLSFRIFHSSYSIPPQTFFRKICSCIVLYIKK